MSLGEWLLRITYITLGNTWPPLPSLNGSIYSLSLALAPLGILSIAPWVLLSRYINICNKFLKVFLGIFYQLGYNTLPLIKPPEKKKPPMFPLSPMLTRWCYPCSQQLFVERPTQHGWNVWNIVTTWTRLTVDRYLAIELNTTGPIYIYIYVL